jgi:tetratricopeptide (TPR) repeat protein
MKAFASKLLCTFALLIPVAMGTPKLRAQANPAGTGTEVQGKVCDAKGAPLAGATVSLQHGDVTHALRSTTDAHGQFRFDDISSGTYTLRAELTGYQETDSGPFVLSQKESKTITLQLTKSAPPNTSNETANMNFSDEPQFTVAGVTDTTNLGGHGSATFMRNRDALSKEAASLVNEGTPGKVAELHQPSEAAAQKEASLRAMLAQHETADLRAELAELEESESHPLDAVRDYQRAAEMEPSEPHLFAWGAELLLHHAYEPAIEVFAKGNRLYPRSVRMLLGLGAGRYAQGTREEATQTLLQASDLDPADPNPYLFLGRLQAIENIKPPGWLGRLKRFVALRPENAMAHYLYAVALSRQGSEQGSGDSVELHLKTAIQLDPHLGNAYLQLGILYAQRKDFSAAEAAFQKAIENTPLPDEGHYRLAQVYRATGNTQKAHEETQLFKQVTEKRREQAERERHEIPQFVYTLRNAGSEPQPASTPRP